MAHTVLVVEDQYDIASLAALILQGEGYDVLTAATGEDGLRLMMERPVDLVLLDLMLPGIDGWEVCRCMRAEPSTADIPILLLTVRRVQMDGDWPERVLINGVINKPFERNDLVAMVRGALAERAA